MREYSSLLIVVKGGEGLSLVLQKRDEGIRYGGHHSVFGGGAKEGESASECLRREIMEELSVNTEDSAPRFYKRFDWENEYGAIRAEVANRISGLDNLLGHPEGVFLSEASQIVDNLFVMEMGLEESRGLQCSEGKKEIIPVAEAIPLKKIPLDQLMLLHYLSAEFPEYFDGK